MSFPIASIRDDFENNTIDPCWTPGTAGSATAAETTGQARFTLPSSTAGSHSANYSSTAAYDLTGDSFFITIGTMVSTSVAATAYFQLVLDASNVYQWVQVSGTLKAQKVVAGVTTDLYSVAWSSSTYKYLRIRESGGTVFFDSSTNGTSWTNRGSTTIASAFAVTALTIRFGASCGNVASPGSLRLDEVNVVLPAPSATWRETTADWSISNRLRSVTLASDGGMQGAIVTADTMDSSRTLGGTLRYFAGPLGSSSGGFLQLTEYASLAAAQTSAFPIPVDGRVDLPAMVDARYMRLYHRSVDASAHTIYEYVPRRLVQADDIEAESIRAINISAGAVTADKIFVISLAAITASMGALHMDGVIDITATGGIYQGSGSFASPTTGLKLFNSGGVGKLSGYNGGTEQITLDTDGKLKAGAGVVILDASGATITGPTFAWDLTNLSPVTLPRANTLQWSKSSGSQSASIVGSSSAQLLMLADQITLAVPLTSTVSAGVDISSTTVKVENAATFKVQGDNSGSADFEITTALTASGSTTAVRGTLATARSSGVAQFGLDATTSGSALTIANNATATPVSNANNFSGMLILTDTNVTGSTGVFLVGSSTVVKISETATTYTTVATTAGKVNVYLTGGGVLTIENKNGSSITFNVLAIRTRTSA